MDNCLIDVTVEFLAITFHNILYFSSVYPPNIFETRKKYSVVVYRCKHPEVNKYIDLCLKGIVECLKVSTLKRVEFAVTDEEYNPKVKFVFDFLKNTASEETDDSYLVQAEQHLRSFCLKLPTISSKLQNMPDNKSFTVLLHTNESTAVSMATNPDLEEFPLVEVEEKTEELDRILPIKRFVLRGYSVDTYVETKYKSL